MCRPRHRPVYVCVACCLLTQVQITHHMEICAAGLYLVEASEPSGAASCVACPAHAYSVYNSIGLGSCLCNPGYTGMPTDSSGCVPCPAGTYKFAAGTGLCAPCDSLSLSTAGSAVCQCFPGYSGGFFDTSAICSGSSGVAPLCESVFALPAMLELTSISITIDVWQTDFSSVSEFITSITTGPVVLGTNLLQYDGLDYACSVQIRVINNRLLPASAFVQVDGRPSLRVHIATNYDVGGFMCLGKTLYARIDIGMRCIPQCPKHGTAPAGTTSRDACACNAGYYGFECSPCPGSSTGTVGATSRQDCTCNAGYFGPECVACARGSYTSAPNNAVQCSSCAVGTYADMVAQTECRPCPARQTTVYAGGYTMDACVCESGTYMTADGGSGGGGGVCVECPAGTYYTLLSADPLANRSNACIACERGTYSDTVGAGSRHNCRACAAGTFMRTEGARSAASCELCAAGTYSFGVLELLGPSLVETWTDAGINQWMLGRHGENCVQTCRAGNMRCVGADGFPQLLSHQTTRALFAQDDAPCRGDVENSTDAAAPFTSEHHACFRGVGASTCSATAAGHARMCPCADHAFLGLDDNFGSPRLVDWAKRGLRLWKLANAQQSCQSACLAESLVCTSRGDSEAKRQSNSDSGVIFAKLGASCKQFLPSSSSGLPVALKMQSGYNCYYRETFSQTNECGMANTNWNAYQLCFCSESYNTVFPTIFRLSNETRAGATTCLECVAGKYSATSGHPACDSCARGKYSGTVAAAVEGVCDVCVPGKHTLEAGRTKESACVACAKGTHKQAGMLVCTPCELGKFSAYETSSECTPCGEDTYANTSGQTACAACFPGKFASLMGSVT